MRRWTVGLTVAPCFILAACATTTIKSVTREANFQAARIHRVLIVSIASTPTIRRLVEDEFVRQWRKRGVEAVASYTVLAPKTTLNKAGVAPFAHAEKYDTVLVNRLMSRNPIDQSVRVRQFGEPASTYEDQTSTATMSEYFQAVVASPQYDIPYEVAVLATNVYDVATEKKLWSGVSQTLLAGDVPKRVGPFVKVILKNLYQ